MPMFEGFTKTRIPANGVSINLVHGGAGPPALLLHGYPQTHVEWHKIAPGPAELGGPEQERAAHQPLARGSAGRPLIARSTAAALASPRSCRSAAPRTTSVWSNRPSSGS